MNDMELWLNALPKAELHLHIDGSLQASRLLSTAAKNKVDIPYAAVAEVEAAYQFADLQSFLDLYYLGASVLRDEEDFYWLMRDYLEMCRQQTVLHTEIMVEPQTYLPYGVSLATVMQGFNKAIKEAEAQWGQSVLLILSLLRHLSEEQAIATLQAAEPYREAFAALGLASAELNNPPEKFKSVYAMAQAQGYKLVAHAGEEGPPSYIWGALNTLNVHRIDHGVRCVEDSKLVNYLVEQQIPLTVCPLSNVCLKVFDDIRQHNILNLLEQGLVVTVNSDDPAYFGGFVNQNFHALANSLGMTRQQAKQLAINSFQASFLTESAKTAMLKKVEQFCAVVK